MRRHSVARLVGLALLLVVLGCPRDTLADVELVGRITELEDAIGQLDQDNAELASRLLAVEGQLARQDTLLRRMSRMLDEVVVALERR